MYKKQWSSANYLPADAHSPLAAAPVALKPMCREIGPATQLCGMRKVASGHRIPSEVDRIELHRIGSAGINIHTRTWLAGLGSAKVFIYLCIIENH